MNTTEASQILLEGPICQVLYPMLLSWLHAVVAVPPAYGSLVLCGPALQLCFVSPPFGIKRKIRVVKICSFKLRRNCLFGLLPGCAFHCPADAPYPDFHPVFLLAAAAFSHPSPAPSPPPPSQIFEQLLVWVKYTTSSGCSFVTATPEVMPSWLQKLYTFPFVGLFCWCPVLNPFVWQPYEPIPAITALLQDLHRVSCNSSK